MMSNKTIRLKFYKRKEGQALVTLLFFVTIGIAIIAATAMVLFINISSSHISEQGNNAYAIAESGIEEALLRLIRDPNYTGQVLSIDSGTATILVQNGQITSTGKYYGAVRKLQAQVIIDSNGVSISSWKEIN
jgi:type II secretory pathway component PulK